MVNADFEKGGTWTGAVEQLDKYRFGPLFVRAGDDANKGCVALLERGGIPWPEPANGPELANAIEHPAEPATKYPEQEVLPLFLNEE